MKRSRSMAHRPASSGEVYENGMRVLVQRPPPDCEPDPGYVDIHGFGKASDDPGYFGTHDLCAAPDDSGVKRVLENIGMKPGRIAPKIAVIILSAPAATIFWKIIDTSIRDAGPEQDRTRETTINGRTG